MEKLFNFDATVPRRMSLISCQVDCRFSLCQRDIDRCSLF